VTTESQQSDPLRVNLPRTKPFSVNLINGDVRIADQIKTLQEVVDCAYEELSPKIEGENAGYDAKLKLAKEIADEYSRFGEMNGFSRLPNSAKNYKFLRTLLAGEAFHRIGIDLETLDKHVFVFGANAENNLYIQDVLNSRTVDFPSPLGTLLDNDLRLGKHKSYAGLKIRLYDAPVNSLTFSQPRVEEWKLHVFSQAQSSLEYPIQLVRDSDGQTSFVKAGNNRAIIKYMELEDSAKIPAFEITPLMYSPEEAYSNDQQQFFQGDYYAAEVLAKTNGCTSIKGNIDCIRVNCLKEDGRHVEMTLKQYASLMNWRSPPGKLPRVIYDFAMSGK